MSLTLLCTFSVSLFCLMPYGCLSYNPAKVMNSIRCRLIKAKLCPLSGVAIFKKETHKEISLKTKRAPTRVKLMGPRVNFFQMNWLITRFIMFHWDYLFQSFLCLNRFLKTEFSTVSVKLNATETA